MVSLSERALGRVTAADIKNPISLRNCNQKIPNDR